MIPTLIATLLGLLGSVALLVGAGAWRDHRRRGALGRIREQLALPPAGALSPEVRALVAASAALHVELVAFCEHCALVQRADAALAIQRRRQLWRELEDERLGVARRRVADALSAWREVWTAVAPRIGPAAVERGFHPEAIEALDAPGALALPAPDQRAAPPIPTRARAQLERLLGVATALDPRRFG